MPEGPEIRRLADRLRKVLLNKPVEVWFAYPELQDQFAGELTGQKVTSVSSRSKALLIGFSEGLTLYSHNQLYGRWFVTARGELPVTNRQLRVRLTTAKQEALLYSASQIEVRPTECLSDQPYLARLGPDLLDAHTTPERIEQQFNERRFCRKRLFDLFLDQAFLGGSGNYLRSEILFEARLHPDRRPVDLSPAERRSLAEAALRITHRAYQTGGITRGPESVAELKKARKPRREYRHMVFSRGDKPCPECGSPIVKETRTGRRVFRCPRCQL